MAIIASPTSTSNSTNNVISFRQGREILENSRAAVAKYAKDYEKAGSEYFGKDRSFFTCDELSDIAQEVCCKACKGFSGYNPSKGKISTWVGTIAYHCLNDEFKKKLRRLKVERPFYGTNTENGEEYSLDETCDVRKGGFSTDEKEMLDEFDADKYATRNEFEQRVNEQYERLLNKEERRIVKWIEQGYKTSEIANMTGCSSEYTTKKIWGIRKTLKVPFSRLAREYDVHIKKLAC